MKLTELSAFLNKLETTSSRNDLTTLTADFLTQLSPKEARFFIYFLQGRVAPKFEPIEFNFSDKMIIRKLQEFTSEDVKSMLGKLGDMGNVAAEIRETFKGDVMLSLSKHDNQNGETHLDKLDVTDIKVETIEELHSFLIKITQTSGKGSQDAKLKLYENLFRILEPQEIKFTTRIILGDLRLGASDKTLLDSLSFVVSGDKSTRKLIDQAFGARADAGQLAEIILTDKSSAIENLSKIKIVPGVPIASKLVEREDSAASVWERMPKCFVQPKLDGLRGQIHFDKKTGEAEVYSRNMERLTDNFPELLESVKNLGVDSVVLDSEIIGVEEDGNYKTYQETMQRRRKYDVETYAKDIPVRAMCFDVLYLNGKDITQEPIEERLRILESLLSQNSKEEAQSSKLKAQGSLKMLETKQMQSEAELEEYFFSKVNAGLEGIITKEEKSTYEPGTRNFKWIKLKANTQSHLVDTIDVVVLGYFYGQGARNKYGFGAMLAGVYDASNDTYYSIGKVGSGFTDEQAPTINADLQKHFVAEKPENYVVDKTLVPDVWVKPKLVMEIVADEITRSPNHTAAKGIPAKVKNDDSTKGLSIRFPRLKIWNRDKDYPNSVEEIVRMYELRKGE